MPGPEVVGRCPVPDVVELRSGRFVTGDITDLVAVQDLGRFEPARAPGTRAPSRLFRLHLLRLGARGFYPVWTSDPLLGPGSAPEGLAGNAWTAGDIDEDGLDELLVFSGDRCEVRDFGPDSIRTRTLELPGAWVAAAEIGDPDADSLPELVCLELSPVETNAAHRLVRVYSPDDSLFVPESPYLAALAGDDVTRVGLLPAVRLEDYYGTQPVLYAEHGSVRPGTYAIVPCPDSAGFRLTLRPFPWQEWFSRERVLPAGPLLTFNVGDTLCAYGFFVPGSRPSGPAESFAALRDGEWRLLELKPGARTIVAPLCRFAIGSRAGWVSLSDEVLRFFPGEPFAWRAAAPGR